MRIAICTPTLSGDVTAQYMLSIRSLERALQSRSIDTDIYITEATVLPQARNALTSIAMHNKGITHVLFIDADIGFSPSAVLKMIDSGHSFVGCICPARKLFLQDMVEAIEQGKDPGLTFGQHLRYVSADYLQKVRLENGSYRFAVKGGFVKTLFIGMGLTLIDRSVFKIIADALPSLLIPAGKHQAYIDLGAVGPVLKCFMPIERDGLDYGEDTSFCLRWRDTGGEIWALVDQEITHVGRHAFMGRCSDKLRFIDSRS